MYRSIHPTSIVWRYTTSMAQKSTGENISTETPKDTTTMADVEEAKSVVRNSTAKTPIRSNSQTLDYDETLMYGQYTKDLGDFAKKEAARVEAAQRRKRLARDIPDGFRRYTDSKCQTCKRRCVWFRDTVLGKIGEDWVFLTLLGLVMALLSFGMDVVIGRCQKARLWLYEEVNYSVAAQYFSWVLFPLVFICFSTGFVHVVGPNAIGSGIPEMKTILRGVVLKEYLTFRTLVAKIVGLCTSLGCGLPIGKEGPFVHVASIAATLLGKLLIGVRGVYEREMRNSEMLAAACAVGVACTFAAPIGGVLFSIEVTSAYFAVRNYWRGFYSAVCGAFMFRLLAIFFKEEETLTALFKTSLRQDFPFDPTELVAFAIIGVACGFAGPLFVYTHRKFVEFIRRQKRVKAFLQKNRFIFPSVVVFLLSSLLFPKGLGQFMAGQLTNHAAVNELFSNFTWSLGKAESVREAEILKNWMGPLNNVFIPLVLFIIMRFWMSALATTLPVPAGVFMPVFTIGAAFGRLMGESMTVLFPDGIGGREIVPGGYAIVGAAALSGSVTHTVSTAVIVFELTGQMGHVLPCVVAVLISNATAHALQPSFYDSLIQIKKLPYLPRMINTDTTNAYRVFVENFMVKDVKFLTSSSKYRDAYQLLDKYKFRSFPLVDSKESMILLGSVQRPELETMIERQLDHDKVFTRVDLLESDISDISLSHHTSINTDLQEVTFTNQDSPVTERSSRFSVSRVEDTDEEDQAQESTPKSILKKKEHDHQSPSRVHFEDAEWETHQLDQTIDYSQCQIDPAPFQVVEKTSLYKVHSLFSLLSMHHAYVSNMGCLVGYVGLKEVREAVQGEISNNDKEDRRHVLDTDSDTVEATSAVSMSGHARSA